MADLWVFGYGSLMWRPGFAYVEARPATLVGYRRCFCIYSVHHRGSARRPGLVLGLDRGGVCHGLAFRVAGHLAGETVAYLRAREQVNGVYREVSLPIVFAGGGEAEGLAYIAERSHPSYAHRLPMLRQAALIRAAHGQSGTNFDYLVNTLTHLRSLGIRERELERLAVMVGAVFAREDGAERQRARTLGLMRSLRHVSVEAPTMRRGDRKRFMHRQIVKD